MFIVSISAQIEDATANLGYKSLVTGKRSVYKLKFSNPTHDMANLLGLEVRRSRNYINLGPGEQGAVPEKLRKHLLQVGWWTITLEPDTEDLITSFWVLAIGKEGDSHFDCLVLPKKVLEANLKLSSSGQDFYLDVTTSGIIFNSRPLKTAQRLAILEKPELLDTDEYRHLNMKPYFNNWQQLIG